MQHTKSAITLLVQCSHKALERPPQSYMGIWTWQLKVDKHLSLIKRHTATTLNPSTAFFHSMERKKIWKQPKHSGESTDFFFLTRKGKGRLIHCKDWMKICVAICSLFSVINEDKQATVLFEGGIVVITLDLE